MVWQ
jgi:hypothetical protein